MSIANLFGEPTFWLIVAVMASFLVSMYFIMREAIASGLEEYGKRERERIDREGHTKGRIK